MRRPGRTVSREDDPAPVQPNALTFPPDAVRWLTRGTFGYSTFDGIAFDALGADDESRWAAWIAQQLKTSRQRGDSLVFEMPESKVVTSLKPARAFVTGLKQIHCGFALEQFDAVGGYRTKDRFAGAPIDASGQLPDGTAITPTGKAFDVEFAQTTKWDVDQLIDISAFFDAALRRRQIGLA